MKQDIHPETHETTISCTCGAVYHTRSTVKNLRIGICAGCHPFFTGEQRFVDTAGRVDKFAKRYGATTTTPRRGKPKAASVAAAAPAPVVAPAAAEESA
ncbi:MAG: 50S ribosomal protein L31 [Roseimicrobium sp.]